MNHAHLHFEVKTSVSPGQGLENSPIELSRYFLILPFLSKIYTIDFYEYQSAFLDPIDLLSETIYYTSFKTNCGKLNKKDISPLEITPFLINESSIKTILEYQIK